VAAVTKVVLIDVLTVRLRALGSMDTITPELEQFLDGLSYPTQKWQITTCADFDGVDVATRRALYDLPVRVYESARDVMESLSAPVRDAD
jgi:hypothetical protein